MCAIALFPVCVVYNARSRPAPSYLNLVNLAYVPAVDPVSCFLQLIRPSELSIIHPQRVVDMKALLIIAALKCVNTK